MFEIIGTDLSARVGRLKTPHGEITTPALLPVIQPVSQSISLDAEDKETWLTFKMIAKSPRECLGAYVISMTSKVSDILSVMLLQKEAGV